MNTMHSEWRGRVEYWNQTLKKDFYEPLGEISWEAFRTMEQLSPNDALNGPFEPVQPGFTWGYTWEYCWFKGSIILPKEAEGKRIVMDLRPNGESTLFVNGISFGTYRADWVSEPHHYFEDNVLSRSAKAGERYDVLMETYAGHYYPGGGGCATGPVLPGTYTDPLPEGARRALGSCTYGIWNEDAYQLFMDADTLYRLWKTLDQTSLRAAKIAKALEKYTLIVDFEQEKEARIASYRAAREALRPALEAHNGSSAPQFYAIGNAHIDLAWLWPMAETYRKTARTFAAQLRLIDEYPDYKFIQSQPAAYEMCRKYYPELFERILQAIKKGQWIADGAMWVEPDTNMAGAEALVRQLLYGKKYYRDVLGTDSKILWLPDTFGYTAALPQILKGCGVEHLVTQKIFWSYNEGEQFPYHYFNWEGMDGTQVVSFLPTSYTYQTTPESMTDIWKNRSQVQDLDAFLVPYGYGDGGGGPARDYLEFIERQKDLEGSPKVKMASPSEFFADMEAEGGPVNTYVGELYFSAHRGTYTSQAKTKQNNRLAELALREMEIWSVLAQQSGKPYDLEQAERLWKVVLLHQFHDILPGSCIEKVYCEAETVMEETIKEIRQAAAASAAALVSSRPASVSNTESSPEASGANGVTILNSLAFSRKALVTLPDAFADGAITKDGTIVPVQNTPDGLKALVTLPSCGGISLLPQDSNKKPNLSMEELQKILEATFRPAVIMKREDGSYLMENSIVRAIINSNGEVTSFIHKPTSREFAAAPMNRFHFYKDVPRLFDAWDIDSNYREQEIDGFHAEKIEVECQGVEAVLSVTGTIGNSVLTQKIRLAQDSTRLEFDTTVDWKELHRLLKTSFPVTVYAENGINEIQFGYVERPTHRSRLYEQDRFEVCNHRYSALCDASHGAAILNDCKYGISMNQNALELTLLRAPSSPAMRADNRVHHFTYAFTAWEGPFITSDVVRQGYELNVPALVVNNTAAIDAFSAVSIDKENIYLEAMKAAEDGSGDVILRLYEGKKAATNRALVHTSFGSFKAYLCDMLENTQEEIPVKDGCFALNFRAFEIKTVRIAVEK